MAAPYRSDEQLQAWIAQTKRNQRRLAVGVFAGALASVVVWWQWWAFAGKAMLFASAVTAVCGFWITGSHIADWRAQLAARAGSRR